MNRDCSLLTALGRAELVKRYRYIAVPLLLSEPTKAWLVNFYWRLQWHLMILCLD